MERRPVLPLAAVPAALCPTTACWPLQGPACQEENKDDERFLALGLRGHLRVHSLAWELAAFSGSLFGMANGTQAAWE